MNRRLSFTTLLALGIVATLFSACLLAARGEEKPVTKTKSVTAELEKAKDKLAPTYRLAYQQKAGDALRTKVVHLATVETKIKGVAMTKVSEKTPRSPKAALPICA